MAEEYKDEIEDLQQHSFTQVLKTPFSSNNKTVMLEQCISYILYE